MKKQPRVFANTVKIDEKSEYTKSVFTLCDYRKKTNAPLGRFKRKNEHTIKKENNLLR